MQHSVLFQLVQFMHSHFCNRRPQRLDLLAVLSLEVAGDAGGEQAAGTEFGDAVNRA